MKLISIVVPVYNVEKYLKQCVYSLINQSYKNIEIILVNDGSKDRSGEICNELEKLDKRIKIVNKKNEGLGLARNTGLEYVNGEYVTFIDSDDYADENLIQELYNAVQSYKADTSIGGFKRVNNDGKTLFKEAYENHVYEDKEIINNLLTRMIGSSPEKSDAIRMSVWNVLYSMDIINDNNLKFCSEREFISEDILFNLEYYKLSQKVVVINNSLYNYRVNQESLTKKYRVDKFKSCKKLYNELYKKIKMIYNDDDKVKFRLQRQYFVNIRSCISQEAIKISGLNRKNAIANIKNICDDIELQNIVWNYPINKLNIKQRTFILLIRYKFYRILYLFAELN